MDGIFGRYLGYSGFADSVPSAARFASKKLSMAIWIDFFAVFMLRPVRCDNCWRRYYSLAKTAA